MPYLFTCPHCQTKTEVDDRYSGLSGQCVSCGGEIQLPVFASQPTVAPRTRGSVRWIAATLVLVVLIGCLAVAGIRYGGQTLGRLTSSRERAQSIKNLEKIAQALQAYAADHGSYPPPATRADDGTAMLSWRVLILPYLGEEELYNRFNLKAGWDDPENMTAAGDVPAVYRHPIGDAAGMISESAYYLIIGPGTLFPPAGPMSPNEVVDDPSQTILVIEGMPLVSSGLWSEPVDLEFSKMSGQLAANPGIDPGGLFAEGAAAVTIDGRGHFLDASIPASTLRALVTPRGGERLADDTLD